MSSFVDKIKVNTAITDNTKLDLGHVHITTANFMQLNPLMCKEMVPGETCKVDMMTFARMQPLAVPTFGRANIKERAFFVPFRMIWRGWNDFITDTPHVNSGASEGVVSMHATVPTVSNTQIVLMFSAENQVLSDGYPITFDGSSSKYDIDILDTNGAHNYRLLTEYGRQILKIFNSLGYKPVWDARNGDVYSALPLYAIAKVYMDWYFPSTYVNFNADFADIVSVLNYDGYYSGGIDATWMCKLFSWITYVNYDNNYFVSAWDNPNSPTAGVYSNFTIRNIDSVGNMRWKTNINTVVYPFDITYQGYVTNNSDSSTSSLTNRIGGLDTAFADLSLYGVHTSTGNTQNLGAVVSEYILHSLHALTDYLKRHQLVGARAVDRYFARFGKMLDSDKLNRSNYIGSKVIPFQVSDVTAMADTSQDYDAEAVSNLGVMTGKGLAFEEGFKFDWTTDEYGYLIVLSSIVPVSGLYQGLDRKLLHITKLNFWTPEFDNLGVQAISTREIYGCDNIGSAYFLSNANNNYMSFNDAVFGFAPRYGEYKYMNDQLTGDFNVASLNGRIPGQVQNYNSAFDSWHLMRHINYDSFAYNDNIDFSYFKHSLNFVRGIKDHHQYDRIFTYYTTDGSAQPDPFTMIYDFNMISQSPMKSLYDVYEFEDKGREVTEQVNGGVKMN